MALPLYRLTLAFAVAAALSGCAVAYRTDIMRKDVRSDAQNAIADTKFDHGDLTIDTAVDRADTTYDPGQPIVLSVKTNKDAFVAILRVLPSGETTIVFPNRAHRDAALKANQPLVVPAPGDRITIAADKPGVVVFEFIASTAGDSWVFKREPDAGSDFANLGVTSRNIAKDLLTSLRAGQGRDTAGVHRTIRITGRDLF